MKLLLHACCGPCSLEPVRVLSQAGHNITIAYMNSNIHPEQEYLQRSSTLHQWAADESIPVIDGTYDPHLWETLVGSVAADKKCLREDRCRACYRMRLCATALYATEHGFDAISTTLTVSPYQYTAIIEEELSRAADAYGITALFEDFRPLYREATKRSRILGMYRQNYCGCRLSLAEAEAGRREAAQKKEQQKAEKARIAAVNQAEALARKAKRIAHQKQQEKRKRILKAHRAESDRS